jgi:hypothetical protein
MSACACPAILFRPVFFLSSKDQLLVLAAYEFEQNHHADKILGSLGLLLKKNGWDMQLAFLQNFRKPIHSFFET